MPLSTCLNEFIFHMANEMTRNLLLLLWVKPILLERSRFNFFLFIFLIVFISADGCLFLKGFQWLSIKNSLCNFMDKSRYKR